MRVKNGSTNLANTIIYPDIILIFVRTYFWLELFKNLFKFLSK